jgi:hypothetical protein
VNADRYLDPLRAVLAGDRDDAIALVVACVQAEPDVAFGWSWGYAGLIGQRVAAIESDADGSDLVDVIRDAAAFLGAASIDDMAGAFLVWDHLTAQRRAEVLYALVEIAALAPRVKASS